MGEELDRRAQPAPQAIEPEDVRHVFIDINSGLDESHLNHPTANQALRSARTVIERLARECDEAIDALSTLVYRYDCEHEGEKPILAPSAIQTAREIIKRHAARQAKPKENADER
jgi:hypothetical protein